MEIENEDELKDNKPHFVNDPALEQPDEDLDEPGMADTDSLLSETDEDGFDDADLDEEDDDLELSDDKEIEDEDLD